MQVGASPIIGATLQDRYRLDSELGRGGMGVVYRAHDTLLDRDVAVKVLSAATLGTQGRARLLREAQAVARLSHPNIVGVYDVGGADEVEGTPFIVMELVEGESLHQRPPQSLDEILSIARQLCAALEHAHTQGIVHRDLKPENVIVALTPSPLPHLGGGAGGEGLGVRVKLMDFGLARSAVAATRLTAEGALVGTVLYLAPEQALGQEVDARADLYALGVVLYELVAGRVPFAGGDLVTIITQHLQAPVVPPGRYRADLPPGLEAIILRLLEKRPADRFASAQDVLRALAAMEAPAKPASVGERRHNLPLELTSFVGREQEIGEVKRLLSGSRLVTLTGSGGCGKTRLSIQAARELVAQYPDGAWLVELASLADPVLVPQTAASVLGVRERGEAGRPVLTLLTEYLRDKTLLLVLDNCEHLIEACAQLADALLRACPNVRILASSREALGIAGETPFRVPSLSLPGPDQLPAFGELMQYEGVRLFVERVSTAQPTFAVTGQNAPAITQICQRLDGIPLAIELAAARVKVLSVEQIAARLDDRFRLLTSGSRTALPRQQTLRAAIDWSYGLLSDAERVLFRRLAAFVGGWTLEAAEAVCAGDGIELYDVLDLLNHLVDKSLVIKDEHAGEARYRRLATVRQYAREKLLESAETDQVRRRHRDWFLRLAVEAEAKLYGPQQGVLGEPAGGRARQPQTCAGMEPGRPLRRPIGPTAGRGACRLLGHARVFQRGP